MIPRFTNIAVAIDDSDDAVAVRAIVANALQQANKRLALEKFAKQSEPIKADRDALVALATKLVVIRTRAEQNAISDQLAAAEQAQAELAAAIDLRITDNDARNNIATRSSVRKILHRMAADFTADETLIAFAAGQAKTAKGQDTHGVLALTTHCLYYHGALLQHSVRETLLLENVDSIQHSSGLLVGTVTATAPSTTLTVSAMNKVLAAQFVEEARSQIKARQTALIDEPSSVPSLADELAKLAALRDSGVLTEDEFQEQKRRLLMSQ